MNNIGKRIKELRKKNDLTQEKLADYLGVERSAMSAELGKLRKDGVIDFNKSRFILL